MENTKLRMQNERIDYLQRVLDVKKALIGRATDKGNRDLIERIKEETSAVEIELNDAFTLRDELEYKVTEQNAIVEEQYLLGQQDIMSK